MYGNGFIKDSLKSLGRLLLKSGKSFYFKAKPKMITFAKDTFKEIKPKIQKSVTEAATKFIDNALNKPKDITEAPKKILSELKDDVKTNLPIIKENAQKTYFQLVNGEGLKTRLNKRSKNYLNQLIKM